MVAYCVYFGTSCWGDSIRAKLGYLIAFHLYVPIMLNFSVNDVAVLVRRTKYEEIRQQERRKEGMHN